MTSPHTPCCNCKTSVPCLSMTIDDGGVIVLFRQMNCSTWLAVKRQDKVWCSSSTCSRILVSIDALPMSFSKAFWRRSSRTTVFQKHSASYIRSHRELAVIGLLVIRSVQLKLGRRVVIFVNGDILWMSINLFWSVFHKSNPSLSSVIVQCCVFV